MFLPEYKYRGVRALIILHDKHLREFLATWKQGKIAGVIIPPTDYKDYRSMDTILRHVLYAASCYMSWICEKLELPNPGIQKTPPAGEIAAKADDYLEHLLDKWKYPLVDVDEIKFFQPIYESRWKVNYCVEAMLEHAVVHPMRHSFQLEEMMKRIQ